jgi:aspartyl-tRNA(Asn)/glutamyl-tRNA(Gln) amidotransferase subunit C
MKLTKEEVQKIAFLARIELTDAEIDKFANQLGDILQYVNILSEVDTSKVEPTYQVTGLTNVTEPDEVAVPVCATDDLLAVSPLAKEARQIVVKNVF